MHKGLKTLSLLVLMSFVSGCGLKSPQWFQKEEAEDNVPHRVGVEILENVYIDAQGSYDMGEVFYHKNTEADYRVAAHYFQNAADGGDPNAQARLGEMYLTGKGVELDYVRATQWLRMAAGNGVYRAQLRLGDLYLGGCSLYSFPSTVKIGEDIIGNYKMISNTLEWMFEDEPSD